VLCRATRPEPAKIAVNCLLFVVFADILHDFFNFVKNILKKYKVFPKTSDNQNRENY
jgi:hypothetical protein